MPRPHPPGCLAQLLLTLLVGAIAVVGLELYADRVRWGVSPDWYRVDEHAGQVRFACQSFAPVQFPAVAGPDITRIALLGGSSSFGYPERPTGRAPLTRARHGFAGVIQATLDAAAPDTYELVNLGVNGGTSEDSLRLLRRALDWDLDGLVIYDGHNEYMSAPSRFHPGLWRWALYRAAAVLAPRATSSPGWVGPPGYGGPEHARAVLDQLETNLSRMVALAQRDGLPVVLATQAGNLAGFDPSWSTAGDPALLARPDPALAEARWAASPTSADLAWQVGQARLDRGADAGVPLRAAADHDGLPFRATSAVNDVIRRVAGEHQAVLVDAEHAIRGDDPVLGPDHFHDWVHPTPGASVRLATSLLGGLASAGLVAPGHTGPVVALPLSAPEEREARLRVARGWLQWACVRSHDPTHRLEQARHQARAVLIHEPGNPDALGVLAVADAVAGVDGAPLPTDPEVRARLAGLHPTLAALLGDQKN